MPIRDPDPSVSLGFGVRSEQVVLPGEQEGISPDASFIARSLHEHPFLRFLTVGAATIVGAHVAGSVVRKQGVKLVTKLGEGAMRGGAWQTTALTDFRETRRMLDRLQGLTRREGEWAEEALAGLTPERRSTLENIGDLTKDKVDDFTGFHFTQGERETAAARGVEASAAHWTMRDEIQKRLVKQARRLPYELPGVYVAQRGLTDKILGVNEDERPKWSNPIDVIGDFATQSLKNVGFAMLPFEAAQGASVHSWRRFMTMADDGTHVSGMRQTARDLSVGMERTLRLVGHDAGELGFQTVKKSRQYIGAFSSAVTETAGKSVTSRERLVALGRRIALKRHEPQTKVRPGLHDLPLVPANDFRNAWRTYFERKDAIGVSLDKARSEGATTIEQLTKTLDDLGASEHSAFRNQALQGEYGQILREKLISGGASKADANKFIQQVRFKSLPSRSVISREAEKRSAESFIGWSEGPTIPGDQTFTQYLRKQMAGAKGYERPNAIADNIDNAAAEADLAFISGKKAIKARVQRKVDLGRQETLRRGSTILGEGRLPYQKFSGPLSPEARQTLVRESARSLDIPTAAPGGGARTFAELKTSLAERGLDPQDTNQLRPLLVTKGKISKPWRPHGENLFGFRKLTVEEGLQRGFFGEVENADRVRATLRSVREASPHPLPGNTPLKGVYTTGGPDGKILDLSAVARGFMRSVDLVAKEFQIPVIHFPPFQALGNYSKLREHGPVMFQSGKGFQPFADEAAQTTDMHMWFRTKGQKGELVNISDRGVRQIDGLYRPLTTESTGLVGRSLRQAIQDPGKSAYEERGKFRKFFNISSDQPDSLGALAKRVKRGRSAPRNTSAFSRMLHEGKEMPDFDAAEGMHNLLGELRYRGLPRRVVEHMRGMAGGRFTSYDTGTEKLDFLETTAAKMAPKLQKLISTDRDLIARGALPDETHVPLTRLLNRLEKSRLTDEPLPFNVRSPSIHRRIDQVREEVYQYLALRQGLVSGQGINQTFEDLGLELRRMERAGQLTAREVTEARAAMLSTQLNFVGATKHVKGITDQQLLLEQVKSVLPGGEAAATRPFLQDIAEGKGRQLGGLPQRKLGFAGYKFPGATYNPFGAAHAFVPTFGTAHKRAGRRAIGSVFGHKTWRDTQAFSGLTIPFTHGITRLNRYFSAAGLGLDATAYQGPADLYLRGMVGHRVFPVVAAGTTAVMVDRTLGGAVNDKDAHGNRVYAPLVLGKAADIAAELQIAAAGALPGGQDAADKEQELRYGEVPVRRGRFWPLGRTPWKGGNEMYFRPSWYQRAKSGYQYTDQTFGSPMERLAFGFDFSPLRPFDPYRFERKHAQDRPYPVSGEYFSGPWGPLTGALNLTAGRILKPRIAMHEQEVAANMATFAPIGQGAMAQPTIGPETPLIPLGGEPGAGAGVSATGRLARNMLGSVNAAYSNAAGSGGSGAVVSQAAIADVNQRYAMAAGGPGPAPPGVPTAGMPGFPLPSGDRVYSNPKTPFGVVAAAPPMSPDKALKGQFGYEMQELLGIYGFASSAMRESLGLGEKDFLPKRPVLASPSTAYGSGRGFWDLALGGMGDVPTPLEGELANLEFSEVMRRFIPKPRRLDVVNPIVNRAAFETPWLPSKFKMGDPYTQIPEGEMRLPGEGYDRTHNISGFRGSGDTEAVRHAILGDTAWWSDEYRMLDRSIDQMDLTPLERSDVETTRKQVEAVRQVKDFVPYEYRYSSAEEQGMTKTGFRVKEASERFLHMNTWFHRKFAPNRTAVEDWESENVYGQTFPQWQNPIKDFLRPMTWKAANRNPVVATTSLGFIGGLFWRTPQTKQVGRLVGGAIGFASSILRSGEESDTGDRWMPEQRRKELGIEENADILNYTRWSRLFETAQAAGDGRAAAQYRKRMKQTMYGADLYDSDVSELAQAVPKRKREYFTAMMNAPEEERGRILSTAPRLERRLYQAAWGMKVEKRPDLEEHFEHHELPPPNWEGWSPFMDMEQVKLKMIHSQGLDAAQMGYYPQQVQQANLVNPAYPDYNRQSSRGDVEGQLRALMSTQGISGSVTPRYTAFPGVRLQVNSGVAS